MIRGLLYSLSGRPSLEARDLEGLARSQKLAYACARDIAAELKEGWTEAQAARLMDVYLRDHGVKTFFHKSFAWFGERTRFDGMRRWRDFLPSARRLLAGDAVILDTAPVLGGYPSDVGYSFSLGENAEALRARRFLATLRGLLRELFERGAKRGGVTGGDICAAIVRHIQAAGFEPAHHRYPGGVLGHRLHPMSEAWRPPILIPFSWQTLALFLRRGVVGDLLNEEHRGDLLGAWAIEPHLGGKGFGCKFEEMLIVDQEGARWLSPEAPW